MMSLIFGVVFCVSIVVLVINVGRRANAEAKGIMRDAEKVNLATLNGYKILLFTSDMVDSGEALKFVDDMVHEISMSAL